MSDERKGDWISTFTGKQVWPLDPRQEEIFILDIAHALSNQCRFSGHTRFHYSVAQHSVLVSRLCSLENALWGLIHDSSEAFLVDVPRPVKHDPGMSFYCEAEARMMTAICERFGLPVEEPAQVKYLDNAVFMAEQRDVMPRSSHAWRMIQGVKVAEVEIVKWTPEEAELAFLSRYVELTEKR